MGDYNMDINLSKLTLEQLIELYKDYVNATDGAAYFVKLAKEKGWW